MKLAQGSKSWIGSSCIAGIFFIILFLVFSHDVFDIIFLFISVVLFFLTGFFLLFFRDPDREISKGVVACADGKIREICNINDEDIGKCIRISTFMNIYNVHVNRMPLDGTITKIVHKKGFHLPAFKKESEKNERVIILIDTKIGGIKVVQIAGTLGRRIVPYCNNGDKLKKGDRIGIIRLGSRVDVYLKFNKITKLNVKVGDIVKAGLDTLAEIND
jgi:phosphatidylserine decarboxylase